MTLAVSVASLRPSAAAALLIAFSRAAFPRAEIVPDIERIREIYPHFFTGAICGQSTGIAE